MTASSDPTPPSRSAPEAARQETTIAPIRFGADPPAPPTPGGWEKLRASLGGDLACPGETLYDTAQPWDRAVSSHPAAVVFAADADDIVAAIDFARANGLRVAVRATGHGAVPLGDDVLLVHTERMTDLVVDVAGRWARAGAGVQSQQVLDAACPAGLAPVCGSALNVGVVGFLTGGGLGPFARTFGISSDHVRALDVVTGDGQLRRATPTEHEDLFWGLRGGKATLGIVTAVQFDLPELAQFYGGALWFAAEDAPRVLEAWRTMAMHLPEAGTTSAAIMNLPPLPQLPAAIAGRQTVSIRFAWTGTPEIGARHLEEVRQVATPLVDGVGVLPYSAMGAIHGDPVEPMPVNSRSALLRELPESALSALVQAVGHGGPHTIVELRALGGAIARAPRHPSAVCHRDAAYQLFLSGSPAATADAIATHADQMLTALNPWTLPGLLPNFAASDDPASIARCYDADSWRRLTALADQYDPDRVLHTGQVARTINTGATSSAEED